MSTLTLASSFDVTVNGPPALCQGISVTACASSTLVVALSWISCMICMYMLSPSRVCPDIQTVLLYSFALLTTTVTHMIIIPDVWMTSVRAVPWFVAPSNHIEAARVPSLPEKALPPHREDVVDIKRLSFHYRTPIFEQHAKTIPTSPRTPPPHEQPQTILAPPRFPTMPASPVWEPHSEAPLPAEPTSPVTPASPEMPSPPPSDPFPMERRTTWTSRVAALTTKRSCESLRPAWAKRTTEGRRGVDQPFAHPRPAPPPPSFPRFSFSLKPGTVLPPVRPLRPLKLKSAWSQSTTSATSPPPVPALPPKAHMHSNRELSGAAKPGMLDSPTSTFYIDLERDSVVPVPAGMAESAARPISYEMFPQDVIDPDQPITRSVRSQWVRADSDASSTQSVR